MAGVVVRFPDRDAPALELGSLVIGAGERIVLSGPSGSGKSTLLGVLLRFVEPCGGQIRVGDVDLRDVPADEWRRQIAWVPQRPYLFAESVADNIRLGAPGASLAEVRDAARLAGAHEFIETLPGAYDTPVGERGLRLSAGQRQRIALARAFLRDAPLLLLDEPTAHLDAASAGIVRDAVERLMAGRTAVIATHDPAWLNTTSRIIDLRPLIPA